MDDQIYLVPGEPYDPDGTDRAGAPPWSRRRRAAVTAGLLVLAGVAVGVQHVRADHLPAPVAAPAQAAAASSQPSQWPQGTGVCDSRIDLPQVSSAMQIESTGVTLPVTGPQPALVDVDTGVRTAIPGLQLQPNQYASTVVRSGPVSYVLVRSCQRGWLATVLRTQAGQPQRVVSGQHAVWGLISDGAGGVWAEAYPEATKISPAEAIGTMLVRVDQPAPDVRLPDSYSVVGMAGSQVVVTDPTRSGAVADGQPLYRYDIRTGKAVGLGRAFSVTESRGTVLWTSTVCSADGPCQLRSYDLATGQATSRKYYLPLGAQITGGVLSPDGRKLAFALQRETPDRLYRSNSPRNPSDLVVLDLAGGMLTPVPGLELPPGAAPESVGFSADSSWLIAAVAADNETDIYSWHSPMTLPQRSPRPDEIAWPGISDRQAIPQ